MIAYDEFMLAAEVCLLREASNGDATLLAEIKADLLRRQAGGDMHIIFMNDQIAVVEHSFVITIADPATRNLCGLPPLVDKKE